MITQEWMQSHPDHVAKKVLRRRKEHPDQYKFWSHNKYAKNKLRWITRRGIATAPNAATESQFWDKCVTYDWRCAYCGIKLYWNDVTVDHIIPVKLGGVNSIDNLAPACGPCNYSKGCKLLEDWQGRKI